MTELDHDDLRYAGQQGESVTLTVEPHNTTQLVSYTLEGQSRQLHPGESIEFSLVKKQDDEPIPISFTIANRTELVKEKEVRGNFGFTFNLDQILARFNPF